VEDIGIKSSPRRTQQSRILGNCKDTIPKRGKAPEKKKTEKEDEKVLVKTLRNALVCYKHRTFTGYVLPSK
jgi:hypothetical protein